MEGGARLKPTVYTPSAGVCKPENVCYIEHVKKSCAPFASDKDHFYRRMVVFPAFQRLWCGCYCFLANKVGVHSFLAVHLSLPWP